MERINIDNEQPSRIKRLHPTLKKCACGEIGTKHWFLVHMGAMLKLSQYMNDPIKFWSEHGEVPLNVEEGDEFTNINWLAGQPPSYNE